MAGAEAAAGGTGQVDAQDARWTIVNAENALLQENI